MSHELVIEAGRAERQYWKDLWRYRELFLILTWRDVAVQYKQTVVGILWAVLRPLLTMAAFTFVFAKVAKLPSEGVAPYPLMVFAAMLPWQLFATAIGSHGQQSCCQQQPCFKGLLSQNYRPHRHHWRSCGGFCHILCASGDHDAVVSVSTAYTVFCRCTADISGCPCSPGARAYPLRP